MIVCDDCLHGLSRVDSGSVAMVFADLPYGRTQNSWDKQVPINQLWAALNRVCRANAAMVFTAIQPFTSLLVTSNLAGFRFSMVWNKNKSSGALNANRHPLRAHEDILVFARKPPRYNPVMRQGAAPSNAATRHTSQGVNYGRTRPGLTRYQGGKTWRYPTSVLDIPVVNNDDPGRIHPTQKPEDLVAWFIRTYTDPGDLVLDPTAGSGTTLVAAKRLGRRYLGFETDPAMVAKATQRLALVTPG
jgi:DNA modification methylase